MWAKRGPILGHDVDFGCVLPLCSVLHYITYCDKLVCKRGSYMGPWRPGALVWLKGTAQVDYDDEFRLIHVRRGSGQEINSKGEGEREYNNTKSKKPKQRRLNGCVHNNAKTRSIINRMNSGTGWGRVAGGCDQPFVGTQAAGGSDIVVDPHTAAESRNAIL